MTRIVAVGVVVALVAAARSTWSPCGLSMLSTITPFGERARGYRYGVTAAWYMLGATAGGACLGGVAAAAAALIGRVAPTGPATLGAAAAVAFAGSAVDAGAFGPLLPAIRRQVDDRWLGRYRQWVYGAGFGFQIGLGLATYLMTAGVVVVAALAALNGSPVVALILGVVFGSARGATVFLTASAATPADLRLLHGRIDRIGPAVRRAAIGVQAGAGLGLALSAAAVVPSGADGALAAGATALVAAAAAALSRPKAAAAPLPPRAAAAVPAGGG